MKNLKFKIFILCLTFLYNGYSQLEDILRTHTVKTAYLLEIQQVLHEGLTHISLNRVLTLTNYSHCLHSFKYDFSNNYMYLYPAITSRKNDIVRSFIVLDTKNFDFCVEFITITFHFYDKNKTVTNRISKYVFDLYKRCDKYYYIETSNDNFLQLCRKYIKQIDIAITTTNRTTSGHNKILLSTWVTDMPDYLVYFMNSILHR